MDVNDGSFKTMNSVPCSVEQEDPSMASLSVQDVSGWFVPSLFNAVIAARLKPVDMMQSDNTEYLLPMEQQFKYPIQVLIPRWSILR